MKRRRFSFRVSSNDVARAEPLLELAGAEAITLADAADVPILEPAPRETPLWPDVDVHAYFAVDLDWPAVRALLERACATARAFRIEDVDEQAWRAAARRGFDARRIGTRLWLAPAEDARAPPASLAGVRLHMGLAFGTGEHPTTSLSLEWLDSNELLGAEVLDYGCGSGVLALAALALGARHAWAIDNDDQALLATRANAELNGRTAAITVGAPADLPATQRFDVVVANILSATLIGLVETFASRLRAGGKIALSGILERQVPDVVSAYGRRFERLAWRARDGWALVEGVRSNRAAAENE